MGHPGTGAGAKTYEHLFEVREDLATHEARFLKIEERLYKGLHISSLDVRFLLYRIRQIQGHPSAINK